MRRFTKQNFYSIIRKKTFETKSTVDDLIESLNTI